MKDPRIQYINNRVAETFPKQDPSTISFLIEENEETFKSFFAGNETLSKIFFTLRPLKEEEVLNDTTNRKESEEEEEEEEKQRFALELSTEPKEFQQRTLYFLRKSNESVGPKEQHLIDSIISGIIDQNSLSNLQILLQQVFVPLFQEQQNWGQNTPEQTKDFLSSVIKFSEKLNESVSSQLPEVVLSKPDQRYHIQNIPKDVNGVKNNQEAIQHLEVVVEDWIVELKKILGDTNENAEEGPISEIKFWKTRFALLNSVMDQLRQDECKTVINLLQLARSDVCSSWKEIDSCITDAMNEAKDNVKYLQSLEKYIELLYTGTPSQIIEIIPGMLKNIRMMHSIARYYSTNDRMTKLFVGITNQMIENCRETIKSKGRLWEQDTTSLISILKSCILLKEEYQRHYRIERDKLSNQPNSKQFDFDELVIFGKFKLFCSRIETLVELFSTIEQFKALQQHNLDGMESIIEKFFQYVEEMKRKSTDLLDYNKNSFDKDYIAFNKKITQLEQNLQVKINTRFENTPNSEAALVLLKKFQTILQRDSLKAELENKYTVIFHNYGIQLENVQKIYEKYKKKPRLVRNAPPVSGNIMWSRQLMRRIEDPMKKFKQIPAIIKSKESKKIIKTYNKVMKALFRFEALWIEEWKKCIQIAKAGLEATLLVKVDEKLVVNFDRQILKLITETKWLLRMGIENIPESAQMVVMQEQQFKGYLQQLTFITKEYERILSEIKTEYLPLLIPQKLNVEKKFEPAVSMLTWKSLNVSVFLKNAGDAVKSFDELVKKINNIIEHRILENIMSISNVSLVSLPPNETLGLDQFVEMQSKHISQFIHMLNIKNTEIEKAVGDVIDSIHGYHPENFEKLVPESEKIKFKKHFEKELLKALSKATASSLLAIRNRLIAPNYNERTFTRVGKPFFVLQVELSGSDLVLRPSIEQLQEGINQAAQIVLGFSKNIKSWKYSNSSDAGSFYQEVVKDRNLIKSVMVLNGAIHSIKEQVRGFMETFSGYRYLWLEDKQATYEKFIADCKNEPTLEDFEEALKKYLDVEEEIGLITDTYIVGSFSLNIQGLKLSLKEHASSWKAQYAKNLHQTAKQLQDEILTSIEDATKKLGTEINSLENLRFVMNTLKDIRIRESKVDFEFGKLADRYAILKRYNVDVPKEEHDEVYDLPYKWEKLTTLANYVNEKIGKLQGGFKKKLIKAVKEFQVDVIQFRNEFETHGPMVQNIKPQEAMERLKKFQRLYYERERKYETYQAGEELFGLQKSDYPKLLETKKELGFLERLYVLYLNVEKKVKGYEEILWSELDFQTIVDEVQQFSNECNRLPVAMRGWQSYQKLSKTINDFLELRPLLEKLSDTQLMRKRHWDEINKLTGKGLNPDDETFKLKDILEANLLEHHEEIDDICFCASKEAEIEIKLKNLANDWKDRELSFAEHGHRGFIILKGQETTELMEALEDSQMTVGSIMSSRFVTPFRTEVSQWMAKLSQVTETLDNWRGVQQMWIGLEAVFSGSGDIAKDLPNEAKKFAQIDKNWVKIMQKANATPNVLSFCYENEMLKNLPYLKEQLEQVSKSLSGYLSQKRDLFPRFYFCSDRVLLDILSQASDPHSIEQHLSQIFDSVASVTFDTRQTNKILSIHSAEKESVNLSMPVIAQGNVEDWLQKLETEMVKTLREIVRRAAEECGSISIKELVEKYPAQVALLGLQFIWTADCEEAIGKAKSEKRALLDQYNKTKSILSELTQMTTKDLSPLERTKVETMITIHVHQTDVFSDLYRRKLKDPQDFEWQRQARFYWVDDQDTCIVWIADQDNEYCYEYLGCKERLVITQLTDRCYVTLSQALGLKLGGAPAGPAGTGKTETVKDLGRTLGKYVVVFNCSDQMDYRAMGKIFKGLAQSGAWGDFDEFNRIELEVLSVVAQQIQCVLSAMRDGSTKFTFTDGQVCKLINKTGIFITMNPGYQGRVELPENLKVQFRGVAMMVPDRRIIIRVKLAASGYLETEILSKKFDVLYKLCEQQLSKQPHYDFGLRNILSVLRTAGETRRSNPNVAEKELLMRTLRDMNISKLVSEDVGLFNSLLKDLFPDVSDSSKKKSSPIDEMLKKHIAQHQLVYHEEWVKKIVQLYDTSLVRHGIMLVGPSGSGKTACYNILLSALSEMVKPHKEARLFPKAITASQMFGKLDVIQNEWTDGIFSSLWRISNENHNTKSKKHPNIWIVCDGPVDAIWIENLNTVLDDNKQLTLANGDRINMSPSVKMCFEVENLRNASPATVSRAGQIYISETVLGWFPVLKAKLGGSIKKGDVVKPFSDQETKFIEEIFKNHIEKTLQFVEKNLNPVMSVCSVNLATTCFDILNALVKEHKAGKTQDLDNEYMEKLFIFSLTWSIGGLLEPNDQSQFSTFVSERFSSAPKTSNTTVFDYFVEVGTKKWRLWQDIVSPFVYPKNDSLDFSTLYVPTPDSERVEYLLKLIANQNKDVLLLGGAGTAKTVTIEHFVSSLDREKMAFKKINFSSATTPNIFQHTIFSVIEKRFRAFGPPQGKKMIVFIDDINMPEINEWGDQVTNEIVRQLMEMKGVYSLDKPGEWIPIEDLQFIGAMSHPGGGKNDIPNRLKRQFAIFNVTLPSQNSIDRIYGAIIRGRYNTERGFSKDIVQVAHNMTEATISLWEFVAEKMLPTPSKFHYMFNLRDLSRVYQGVMLCPRDIVKTPEILVSLWKHECNRVFSDKLNDVDDKIAFDEELSKITKTCFGDDLYEKTEKPGYFTNFLRDPVIDEDTLTEVEEAPKIYEPIESIASLRSRLEMFIKKYNEVNKVRPLDLVLFDAAVKHIVRISRILAMPRGNALLVGVGGSGKQSLTRLSSFIAGYETKQIVLHKNYNTSNLFEDLKEYYKLAGHLGKPLTFIFTDNEIKKEEFLEYINNILSSGEIAGLFQKDELDSIVNDLRPIAKKQYPDTLGRNDTWDNLYKFFIDRVRDNLHIVLCFSPVNEKFRSRAQKFPGLISGCTINWFFPWPEEALLSVARKFLENYKIECEPEVKENLIHHMANVHLSMNAVAEQYFERFRRHVYTTPKSYLSFIQLYKEVYVQKLSELGQLSSNVNRGLEKLKKAGEDVKKMQEELKDKELRLAVAKKETDELLKEISISTAKAQKKKDEVELVTNALAKDQAIVQQGTEEAERDLADAKPALEEALKALSAIKPGDISYLKGLKTPPELIKRVFDGVLILRHFPLEKVTMETDKKGRKVIGDSYVHSLKMMADTGLLKALVSFDKDGMNEETIELLEPYLSAPDYNKQSVMNVSPAAAALCTWVRAMVTYHQVAKDVRPKKEKLMIEEAKLVTANAKLKAKQEELALVEADLAAIQSKFDEAARKKKALEDDAESTKRKMEQANSLIESLSGENSRWTRQSNEFKDLIRRLTGDVALASAFISYCGPFNSEFRRILLNQCFYKDCVDQQIPVTKGLVITKLLTDEAQVGEWGLQGLPSDEHSVQNAIMVTRSSKWPILVDPQGQGLGWLKKREKDNNLKVTRLSDRTFRQVLEECMSFGYALIIENIEEDIDPMLDPVLEKAVVQVSKTSKQIMLADKPCEYDDNFKLFLTTKLSNPHFAPELYAKTTVIDFTVTMTGLEEQLLGYVIQKEKAELEERREKLLQEVNQNQKKIKALEDELLDRLSNSEKNLLEDEDLVRVLGNTKKVAIEVEEKLKVARETEKRIGEAREEYREVAIRGSVLYFLIVEMSLVNPMYQTSLSQFLILFDKSIFQSEPANSSKQRIINITDFCTQSIFQYVSRGLFKRHKLLFVLLIACKILLRSGKISYEAFGALLKGGAALDIKAVRGNPCASWLPDKMWLNIINLSNCVDIFQSLPDLIANNPNAWNKYYDEEKPELCRAPDKFADKLTKFQILLLIRSLREDRTILAANEFISETLGPKFVDAAAVNLEDTWKESSNITPLICLLSAGSDPTSMIEGLAKKKKKEVHYISMGQGQGKRARELLVNGFTNGNWVLLQNCHLGLSFMNTIEDTLRDPTLQIHPDFRLWITSEPNPKFPIGLLQMSIKLTLEGDVGIKAGMKSAFQWVTQDMLDASRRPEWRPLLYTICFLNTIVSERRKFGPLGWNIPYEFNYSDLTASLSFLQNHFAMIGDDYKKGPQISWATVRYMICEVHYGGKITDDFDRLLFKTYGDKWLSDDVAKPDFSYCPGYIIPNGEERQKYIEFIEKLPPVDMPSVFGLNPNADIRYRSQQSHEVLSTILDIQPKESAGAGGETREGKVKKIAEDLFGRLPPDFKKDNVKENIKRLGGSKSSLNIFLEQEIDRFQILLSLTRKTLVELRLAISGTIIMNETLLNALNNLHDARVPNKWLEISWEAASLGLWFTELIARYDQLFNWLTKDPPKCYWLTGFYNPQGFLTSVRQEVSRARGWSLDDAVLVTNVTKLKKDDVEKVDEGVYVHGLFLEGAGWDNDNIRLAESTPKVPFTSLPVLHITAASEKKEKKRVYSCPTYRNKKRTGYNYIFDVDLNTTDDPSHWRLRGVALLCNKD